MIPRPFSILGVAWVLALAACHHRPQPSAAAPEPAVTATPAPIATPSPTPTGASTPTISLAEGSTTVTVSPAPTPCGAEKLSNYLNLLPTSTAKDEIARTLGQHDIRYVPLQPPPLMNQPGRVTAEVGVDGRIKKFACG